jgi:hypothetical protein
MPESSIDPSGNQYLDLKNINEILTALSSRLDNVGRYGYTVTRA